MYHQFFTDTTSQKIADTHQCQFRLIGTPQVCNPIPNLPPLITAHTLTPLIQC